jgi:uncharacterized protein
MTDEAKTFDPSELGLSNEDVFSESLIRSVLAASGGEVLGRIKFQKLVFLLDKLGLESGFKFSYHHYGPYSAELSSATDIAKAFGLVAEEFRQRKSDGASYSVFKTKVSSSVEPKIDFLRAKNIVTAISLINSTSSTIVELAATAYWLKNEESIENWEDEIVRRKGSKVDNGRLEKALELLEKINLKIAA